MGPSGRIGYILDYIALFGTGYAGFRQVLYLGRAPRTKETQPYFREKCRVTRHSRVFRRLTGSQRTPRVWGVTALFIFMTQKRIPQLYHLIRTSKRHQIHFQ